MLPVDRCTGCGVCMLKCPRQSISMEKNSEGFRYPAVNTSKCINCKICEEQCPVLHAVPDHEKTEFYAVQNQNSEIRIDSSSGGFFFAVCSWVIDHEGIICAAKYDHSFSVIHGFAGDKQDARSFLGAKYAQSDAYHCFLRIKEYADQDKLVLFVGTPCQAAGLRRFLGKDYPNVILVDMICHGVPSPNVWERYVNERRKKDANGAAVTGINLRNKDTGWTRYGYSVVFDYENGKRYQVRQNEDPFMKGFVRNLYLRASCSNCEFKGTNRCTDLTLGDYWGVWNQHPEMDDNTGTSLVMIHSGKGAALFSEITNSLRVLKLLGEDCLSENPSALVSSQPHNNRGTFFEKLNSSIQLSELIEECLGTGHQSPKLRLLKTWIKKAMGRS